MEYNYLNYPKYSDYSAEKIIAEKRKRHQTYAAMDYLLSVGTYFDFFSADAFKLVKSTTELALKLNRPIDTDLFFLSYFYCNSSILKLFKSGEFQQKLETNRDTYFPELIDLDPSLGSSKTKKLSKFLKKLFRIKHPMEHSEEADYSHELLLIFEKASENALTRFKTPVITSEILFITLMEENSTKISKVIKSCFDNEVDWYLFRYDLMKVIHRHESAIRSGVIKNQQYFAYLFRAQLSDFEFNNVIEKDDLRLAVKFFRRDLIRNTLKIDIYKRLLDDIHLSIKITNKRTYSS